MNHPPVDHAHYREFKLLQVAVKALAEALPNEYGTLGTCVKRGQYQAVRMQSITDKRHRVRWKVESISEFMPFEDMLDWIAIKMPQPRLASCVSVLIAMGFEEISTGGGCTALHYERPDGQYCMVTDDATAPKDTDKNWDVGFYANTEMDEAYSYESYERGHKNGFIKALEVIAKWRVG